VNNNCELKIQPLLQKNKSDNKILKKNIFIKDLIGSISEQEESSPSKLSFKKKSS
jgi:hypothetical protein